MDRFSDLERKYVLAVLDNGFATSKNNEFTARLEAAFAGRFGRNYAIAFANGTATLHCALLAMGIGEGDEVIVPPLTMSSPALSVLHAGATPVFADVDPETFNLDPADAERKISSRTKAIMPVALYGLPFDGMAFSALCAKHDLGLIEDNAECFLGSCNGRLAGAFGTFASFSFQASKHMTCGEGGILLCDDRTLADNARRWSSLGYGAVSATTAKISKMDILSPDYDRHVTLGYNFRMSELQSAVALGQFERLDELVENRCKCAAILNEALHDFSWLRPQKTPAGWKNSYWTFAVVFDCAAPSEWYALRDAFLAAGADLPYGAWKLGYMEPYFQKDVAAMPGVFQKYEPDLCPTACYLQKRLMQFKTNYWNLDEARMQADRLHAACAAFAGGR